MVTTKRAVGAVALVALGVLTGSLLIRQGATVHETTPRSGEGNATWLWPSDDPLGGADLVPREVAEDFLSSRSGGSSPTLPTGATVTQSWVRIETGSVAFELANGMTVVFQLDGRSGADFVADATRMGEAEGPTWPFSLVPLRGTQAQVTDINERVLTADGVQGPGPAAVAWVEGGYLVSLVGGPPATASGLPLSELLAFAEAMG